MLWGVILSFKFTDLIDILVIAFIIYKVFLIVRETRATQLFKGLIFLLLVVFLAKVLNLKTLDFIVSKLFFWGPVIIVILFQSEFRRILEHVGRAKMRGRLQNFLFSEKNKDKKLQVLTDGPPEQIPEGRFLTFPSIPFQTGIM